MILAGSPAPPLSSRRTSTWPSEPVVALAYIDQLQRSASLSPSEISELTSALDRATLILENGDRDENLAKQLGSIAKKLKSPPKKSASKKQYLALQETVDGIAKRLR